MSLIKIILMALVKSKAQLKVSSNMDLTTKQNLFKTFYIHVLAKQAI